MVDSPAAVTVMTLAVHGALQGVGHQNRMLFAVAATLAQLVELAAAERVRIAAAEPAVAVAAQELATAVAELPVAVVLVAVEHTPVAEGRTLVVPVPAAAALASVKTVMAPAAERLVAAPAEQIAADHHTADVAEHTVFAADLDSYALFKHKHNAIGNYFACCKYATINSSRSPSSTFLASLFSCLVRVSFTMVYG